MTCSVSGIKMDFNEWVKNELYQELLEMPLWVASAFSTKENDEYVFNLDVLGIRLVHHLICKWVDKAPFNKIDKINYKLHYDIENYKPLLRQVWALSYDNLMKPWISETTLMTGIICKACKNELPMMTVKEHLDGRGCPCQSKCPLCKEHNGPLEFKTDLGHGDEMVCKDCYDGLMQDEADDEACEFCADKDEDDHECIPERSDMDASYQT